MAQNSSDPLQWMSHWQNPKASSAVNLQSLEKQFLSHLVILWALSRPFQFVHLFFLHCISLLATGIWTLSPLFLLVFLVSLSSLSSELLDAESSDCEVSFSASMTEAGFLRDFFLDFFLRLCGCFRFLVLEAPASEHSLDESAVTSVASFLLFFCFLCDRFFCFFLCDFFFLCLWD